MLRSPAGGSSAKNEIAGEYVCGEKVDPTNALSIFAAFDDPKMCQGCLRERTSSKVALGARLLPVLVTK